MKKTIIAGIVLLFLFCTSTMAQPYKSIFGKNKTSWLIFGSYGTDSIYVTKDTLINGIMHKEIWALIPSIMVNYLYVTEDTNSGHVYMYNINDGQDVLLYDYSLEQGDTICWSPYIGVDSVYFENGNKIIELNYTCVDPYNSTYKHRYIEGIGCNMGFSPIWAYGGIQVLLCSYKDGIQVFQNTDSIYDGQCWITGIEEKRNQTMKIWPNPAHECINIECKTPGIKQVGVFDLMGRIQMCQSMDEARISLNVRDLPPGIYLIRMQANTETVTSKFIKITSNKY